MLVETKYNDLLKAADQYKLKGEHEQAIKICQEILFDDLICVEAYEEIGDNYMNLRQYDKAIIALNRALKINPESPNALYLIGFAYSAISEWLDSELYLNQANKLEPNHPEILRCLGWTIFHSGRQPQGLIILNRAATLAPNDCFIISDLGMCQLSIRNFEAAEKNFQHILKIEPQNTRAKECLDACRYFKIRQNKTKAKTK